MSPRSAAAISAALIALGACGGDGQQGVTCADVFTTTVKYGGQEVVAGCYFPGTYAITASIAQSHGTCDAQFAWQAVSGAAHQCAATLSGDATRGYDLDFERCSLPGSIHVLPDLSAFTGGFRWTVTCGSGTTTFQNMAKSP